MHAAGRVLVSCSSDENAGRASAMTTLGKFFHQSKRSIGSLVTWTGPAQSFDEGSRLLERPQPTRRHRRRIRQRALGTVFFVFGILVWVITAILPHTAYYARLVLRSHVELLSIGIVVGGAFVAAGIIQIGTSLGHRSFGRR